MTGGVATLHWSNAVINHFRKECEVKNFVDVNHAFILSRDALLSANVRFAVIGGIAYGAYVEPRATEDVDYIVHYEDMDLACDILMQNHMMPTSPISYIKEFRGVKAVRFNAGYGVLVDLLSSTSQFFTDAINRAVIDEELQAPLVGIEALIVLKKISGDHRTQSEFPKVRRKGKRDYLDLEDLLEQKYDDRLLNMYCVMMGVSIEV